MAQAIARDRQILKAMADALRVVNAFDDVMTAGLPEAGNDFPSGVNKACVLELVSWVVSDDDTADSGAGEDMVREVLFTAWVSVRDEDPDTRDDEADRLACLVENTLGNTSFLSATLPGMTYFLHGEWQKPTHPERRIKLDGHTAYLIDSWQSHDADSDT